MRKILNRLSVVALATVSLVSCQEFFPENNGDMCNISFTASLPAQLSTYAMSGNGGLGNVDDSDLRYVVEAWTKEETPRLASRIEKVVSDPADFAEPVSFSMRLVAREYDFLFWADFIQDGAQADASGNFADRYYDTNADDVSKGLKAVTIAGVRPAGAEAADAYYAVCRDVMVNSEMPGMQSVTLKRPFGKIRLLATDIVTGQLGDKPMAVKVAYDADAQIPVSFNVLTEKAENLVSAGSYLFAPYFEKNISVGDLSVDAYIVGIDYLFASDAVTSVAFDVTTYADAAATDEIGTRHITDVPFAKNKLTTVYGNFYSGDIGFDIDVSDIFENQEDIEH